MNLYRLLKQREADHKPLRVALLGAGKFGAMFMSQAPRTPGIRLVAVADLMPDRARAALTRVGWPASALNAGPAISTPSQNVAAPRTATGPPRRIRSISRRGAPSMRCASTAMPAFSNRGLMPR